MGAPVKNAKLAVDAKMKPFKMPASEQVTQPMLKPYMPPDSYLWVARLGPSWCSRVPPYKTAPFAWAKHGGDLRAAKCAVRHACTQWLALNGLPADSVPTCVQAFVV